MPDQQVETRAGHVPMLALLAWPMVERAGLVSRTMLNGPKAHAAGGSFNAFMSTRGSMEEMARWQRGSTMIGGVWRGIDKFSGKSSNGFGNKFLRGSSGIMGTPYAPSSWMTSAKLLQHPDWYGEDMMRMFTPEGYGEPSGLLSSLGLKGRAGVVPEAGAFDSYFAQQQQWREFSGAGAEGVKMTSIDATHMINQMLRIGSGAATNVGKDIALGSMYNLNELGSQLVGASGEYAKMAESSIGIVGKIGGMAQRGNVMSALGADFISGSTKFGAVATTGLGIASVALRGLAWGLMAKDAAKLAYKAGELYMYKLPKAMLESGYGQITREAFAGGDAALLTGIPANNRMRSVQAIQGSRMNARSALGGEASLLAGHFS